MRFVMIIAAGLIAAAAAWQLNNFLQRLGQHWSIAWLAPLVEESSKTGFAVVFSTSLPGTHFIFGFIEAIYDYFTPPNSGITTWLTSILGHLGFGLLTLYLWELTGNFLWGWLGAVISHLIWNNIVLRLPYGN